MNRHERRAGLAHAKATRDEWHSFERVDTPEWIARNAERLAEYVARQGALVGCWRNNVFSVQAFARGDATQLVVRRHDGGEVHGWSDLQRVKNEVVGPDRVAIEVYPRDSDVVDHANLRHLFVLPDGTDAPFTIQGRWE